MVAKEVLATDPGVLADLDTARLGTAYFRRVLNRVPDSEFDAPSLLPGWAKRHVVAHVGYNARAVARLVTWAATGVETPMYSSPRARGQEIEFGATLRPDALRSLCEHAAIDLDVRWRDLPDRDWQQTVVTAQGRSVPVSETLWMRSREVWLHAIDLDGGARLSEVPDDVLSRLLADIVGMWRKREQIDDLAIVADVARGEALHWGNDSEAETVVRGPLPAVVSWATGRAKDAESDQLTWLKGRAAPAPRWL